MSKYSYTAVSIVWIEERVEYMMDTYLTCLTGVKTYTYFALNYCLVIFMHHTNSVVPTSND